MSAKKINEDGDKPKRPKDKNLYQQRLRAWKPVLTAKSVAPFFLVIGLIFIPVGVVLLVASNGVTEKSVDYTDCIKINGNTPCSDEISVQNMSNSLSVCYCNVNITFDSDISGPVYLFYGLNNYYQNHRRYVRSRDDDQLLGRSIDTPSEYCAPYEMSGKVVIAPCGSIANSLFSDQFTIKYVDTNTPVPTLNTGIAWKSDVDLKFGKPASWANTTKPLNWYQTAEQRSPDSYAGDEELLVWMRTAALPNFRKLNRRIDHSNSPFKDGLPKGAYQVTIAYRYPVKVFDGRKLVILSNTSWMGGKNPVLGIAYLVTGCVHITLAIIFAIIHFRAKRRLSKSYQLS